MPSTFTSLLSSLTGPLSVSSWARPWSGIRSRSPPLLFSYSKDSLCFMTILTNIHAHRILHNLKFQDVLVALEAKGQSDLVLRQSECIMFIVNMMTRDLAKSFVSGAHPFVFRIQRPSSPCGLLCCGLFRLLPCRDFTYTDTPQRLVLTGMRGAVCWCSQVCLESSGCVVRPHSAGRVQAQTASRQAPARATPPTETSPGP